MRIDVPAKYPGDEPRGAPEMNERDILASCALRFRGWEYLRKNPFDHRKALDRFFESRRWDLSEVEQLCMFYLLYEGLFKLDLRDEPENGEHWQAFRELFCRVAALQVPEEYEDRDCDMKWTQEYQPHLNEVLEYIRRIHDDYMDDGDGYSNVWF
jgi:hypothetical protein